MPVQIDRRKILDGTSSLSYGNITPGTLTIDGRQPPATITIDYNAGLVSWTDQQNLGDPGPYIFEYTWEEPALSRDEERLRDMVSSISIPEFLMAYFEERVDGDFTRMNRFINEWNRIKNDHP